MIGQGAAARTKEKITAAKTAITAIMVACLTTKVMRPLTVSAFAPRMIAAAPKQTAKTIAATAASTICSVIPARLRKSL